jgi:hypothetical protein
LPTAAEFQVAVLAAGGGQSAVQVSTANTGTPTLATAKLSGAVLIEPNLAVSIAPFLDQVSYWSLCAIATVAGGVVWVPWSRRFGLRTIFIATTVVAVGMGLVVWAIRG